MEFNKMRVLVAASIIAGVIAIAPASFAQSPRGVTMGISGSGDAKQLGVIDGPGGTFLPFATVDAVGHTVRILPAFLTGVDVGSAKVTVGGAAAALSAILDQLPLSPRGINASACTGSGDDTVTLQTLASLYNSTGRSVYIPDSLVCNIASTIVFMPVAVSQASLLPPPAIKLGRGARIVATAAMTSMFQIGSVASDYSGIIREGLVEGGIFDAAGLASIGVSIPFTNDIRVRDSRVGNFQVAGVKIGQTGSPSLSYGALLTGVTTYRDIAKGFAPTGSSCILFENSNDSHVSDTAQVGGCRTGVSGAALFDSKFTNVHLWNVSTNGRMTRGFDLAGDNQLVGVQVDGPFAAAFHFSGQGNRITASEVNYGSYGHDVTDADGQPVASDNTATVTSLDTGATVFAAGNNWKGDPSYRIASEASGAGVLSYRAMATRNLNVVSQINFRDPSLPTMWASIQGGTSPTMDANFNVASLVRNAAGDYTINTANPLGPGPIICNISTGGGSRYTCDEAIGSRGAYTRRIKVSDSSGNLGDPLQLSVMTYGSP